MIDIHSHILPAVDDGSQSLEESLDMARAAAAEGIRTLIATPHHANGRYWNEAQDVREQVAGLNAELRARGIDLTIVSGQEVRVYDRLLDDLQDGKLVSLNDSRYLLLEFPSSRLPDRVEELIYELQVMSIVPVIAHPERNREIAEQPDKLVRFIEGGALSQLTAHSLLGGFGKSVQSLSMELCRRNLVHLIASDAHNLQNRPFGLGRALDAVESALGREYRDYYDSNSQSLMDNERIDPWQPVAIGRKWYQFWKRSG